MEHQPPEFCLSDLELEDLISEKNFFYKSNGLDFYSPWFIITTLTFPSKLPEPPLREPATSQVLQ